MPIVCIPMEIAFHGKFQFIVFSHVTDTATSLWHLWSTHSTSCSISITKISRTF